VLLHVPIVWVLWFPLLAATYTLLALVSSLRTRAYLTGDAFKIISWVTENKYTTRQQQQQRSTEQHHHE